MEPRDHSSEKGRARARPEFLVVAIGGHGNWSGFGAADGDYGFVRLRDKIEGVGAHGTAAFINTCGAGGFAKSATVLSGIELEPTVDPLWCATLLATSSGVRAFMATGANEKTYEDRDGSWYFEDLLAAMYAPVPGDLAAGAIVSDGLVVSRAHELMAARGVHSRVEGVIGDFPLMWANIVPVGDALARLVATRNLSAVVEARIRGRRHLPTTLCVTPFVAGVRHQSTCKALVPMADDVPLTSSVMIDLSRSPLCSQQLWASGTCRITWRVEVFDESDRRLALWDFPVSYETTYQSGGRWLGP